VLFDSIADAMVSTVFVSVLYSMCVPAYSATQVALLTSLSSLGQRAFAPINASIVAGVGWAGFFLAAAALTVPGIVLARYVNFAPEPEPH